MTVRVAVIAGEASGDQLGGDILAALKAQADIEIVAGVGGPRMQAQGLSSLFDYTDLSIMGIVEILKQLPKMIERVHQTVAAITAAQPDVLITIDCPEFSKPVVKKLRRTCPRTRFVHIVAPTVWAWRPGRARVFARLFDRLLCLFPFEPPYFEKEGMKADFIGHTAVEKIAPVHQNDGHQPVTTLLVLPGSRKQEITSVLPVFINAIQCSSIDISGNILSYKILTLPHLVPLIEKIVHHYNTKFQIVTDKEVAFRDADVAIAASGTIGLELSLAGIPHLVAYKVNALTAFLGRLLIRTPFVHLGNILLQKAVVPELIQERATPMAVSMAMDELVFDPAKRTAQRQAFKDVRAALQTKEKPSDCAARLILNEVGI